MTEAEESSALDGCQHADSGSSEMRIGYPTEEERMWRETSAPQGVMRSQSGAIAECLTNSQSRRLRKTISHCSRKPLQAEFFAKPVLRLSDPICIENHDVAAGKVS